MIDKTLKERNKVYGDYKDNIEAVANIMDSLKCLHECAHNNEPMPPQDEANLYYIVIKLARLGVTPNHIDSWHDLQGYAKLAEDYYADN